MRLDSFVVLAVHRKKNDSKDSPTTGGEALTTPAPGIAEVRMASTIWVGKLSEGFRRTTSGRRRVYHVVEKPRTRPVGLRLRTSGCEKESNSRSGSGTKPGSFPPHGDIGHTEPRDDACNRRAVPPRGRSSIAASRHIPTRAFVVLRQKLAHRVHQARRAASSAGEPGATRALPNT